MTDALISNFSIASDRASRETRRSQAVLVCYSAIRAVLKIGNPSASALATTAAQCSVVSGSEYWAGLQRTRSLTKRIGSLSRALFFGGCPAASST